MTKLKKIYLKVCDCTVTSSGPRKFMRFVENSIEGDKVKIKFQYGYAGMVCDKCDMPWDELTRKKK